MDNRRVKITKKMIKDAMLELLENRPINKITVTDICAYADVNRSTFYAYYDTTIDLIHEIEDDVLNQLPPLSKELPIDKQDQEFIKTLESFFSYVKDNHRLFKILIIQNSNNDFNQKLIETVMKKYTYRNSNKKIEKYSYIYCISGVIGLVKEWINNDFNISTTDFSNLVFQISSKAIEINDNKIKL